MMGTAAPSDTFVGGSDTFSVQITNVNSAVTEATVRDHLTMELNNDKAISIKDTTTEGWPTKRFLITLPKEVKEKVLNSDFWPPQVYFRQYFVSRGQGLKSKSHHG